MYRVYMGEFKMAMRTLSNYQKESPQFKGILALIQQTPFCERLSLASYLLTPIQRLPRYELLLKVSMRGRKRKEEKGEGEKGHFRWEKGHFRWERGKERKVGGKGGQILPTVLIRHIPGSHSSNCQQ